MMLLYIRKAMRNYHWQTAFFVLLLCLYNWQSGPICLYFVKCLLYSMSIIGNVKALCTVCSVQMQQGIFIYQKKFYILYSTWPADLFTPSVKLEVPLTYIHTMLFGKRILCSVQRLTQTHNLPWGVGAVKPTFALISHAITRQMKEKSLHFPMIFWALKNKFVRFWAGHFVKTL